MVAKNTFRCLLKELRLAMPSGYFRDSLAKRYIMAEFKALTTTDQQFCKARDEVLFLSKMYLTYLCSQRQYTKLQREFLGKGELTVKETADMMGFKLPTDSK